MTLEQTLLAAPTLACTDVLKYVRPTILVTDRVGTILQAHGGSGRPLGYRPEELQGQHGLMFIAPEDHQVMADTYLASGDLPIVTAPEPFPVRMIGPTGETHIWDCVPGGFTQGDQDGWVLTLTCRAEQNASIEAMDCFIDGGSPLDIARVVSNRYQASPHQQWRKHALVVHRATRADGSLSDWKMLEPPAGAPAGLGAALAACLDDPTAPWHELEPGSMQSDTQLPATLRKAAEQAGLPYCTTLAVGIDGATRMVFIRLSNFTRELQVNNKLSDKAIDATLRRSLSAEMSRALLDKTMRLDPLTGIANRLHFDEIVDENGDATDHAVLYIDIDKFKAVNDSYGHAAGDAVLRVVANRIARACRPNDLVARIGGDEFAVILRGICSEEAQGVASRITASMQHPLNVDVGPDLVTVTIGVATATENMSLSELLHQADHAMLTSKPETRSDVVELREPYAVMSDRRVRR